MCDHYDRNCEILCERCCKYYTCRFCHNENENHEIDRNNINWIKCLECGTEQVSKKKCINCKIIFGEYYCKKCRLFENNIKHIFHCDDCNICRIGPKEKYYHCNKCNTCISITLKNNHKCIENSSKNDCPICLEYLFNSRIPFNIMICGHNIHTTCLNEYSKRYINCPICRQSLY